MSATPPDHPADDTIPPAEEPPPRDDHYVPGDLADLDAAGDDPGFRDLGFAGSPAEAAAPDGLVAGAALAMRSPTADLPRDRPSNRNPSPQRAMRNPDPQPPSDLNAERALLSSALIDARAVALVVGEVRPEDFYDARHGLIFEAMTRLFAAGRKIEPIAVHSELLRKDEHERAGGLKYIIQLSSYAGSSLSVEHYATTIARLAQVRRILTAAHTIQVEGYKHGTDPDEVVNLVQDQLVAALDRAIGTRHKHIAPVVEAVFQNVLAARERGQDVVGFDTGFRDLNAVTYGFHRQSLVILAARPAMGKTALALNVALAIALQKVPDGERIGEDCSVMIFSLEMGAEELVQRLLAQRARVGLGDLKKGTISQDDEVTLREATADLGQLKMYIDDTPGINSVDLRARAKRVAMTEGLDVIVVDYLQLMKGTGGSRQSREQEISEISRSLKGLAKELNVVVIALSQLNRSLESRANKRPIMSDLRESGAIEQDADMILFVYRDCIYNPETAAPEQTELIIGKHRAGKLATINLHFEGRFTRFTSVDAKFDDKYVGSVPFG